MRFREHRGGKKETVSGYTILDAEKPAPALRVRLHLSKWLVWPLTIVVLLAVGTFIGWVYLLRDIPNSAALIDWPDSALEIDLSNMPQPAMEKHLAKLQQRNTRLEKELEKLYPRDTYIVIDTAQNRLYLKQNDQVLREAVCSTGSGRVLEDPQKNRKWIFDTPRGEFRVRGKIANPVWRKPDWAFIEEGQPVPRREEDRYESGVLGDYGLAFGDGFFIHGTLYTRLLGRSVTHGCVRMGDQDLEFVFNKAPIYAKIFIY